MKYGKLLFLILLSLLLFAGACSNDDEGSLNSSEPNEGEQEELNFNETGFPIVKEEITLDFFAGQAGATNDNWNDVMLFNEYEEMTNMKINWNMVSDGVLEEQRNLALGSGDLPDAFHSARLGTDDLTKYGEQGLLLPLNDLIDEYAPIFKQILEDYPKVEKLITMPDGNIYAFPQMSDPEFLTYRMGAKPFINKEWLDELEMDIPETTEEYYQFLKAVNNESPSNGEVDEIPFGGPDIGNLYYYLAGAFNIANKGLTNGLIDLDPDTEEYRFYPTSDAYKELMEYMHKLYSEELIEQNIFSIQSDQYLANASEGKYGSVIWWGPTQTFGEEVGSKFVGMPALEGPHGDKNWLGLMDPVLGHGAFVLTQNNDHPESTVRWIDYFYGDEGLEMFFMGIEGETYEMDGDDNPVYMDHILNSKDGLSFEQELAKYVTFPGGGYPSMTTEKFFRGAETTPESLDAAEKLSKDLIDPWIKMSLTNEEIDEIDGIATDIEKYVDEMRDKFISGDEPLSKWDDYVKELEKMNLDKYIEVRIRAIERQFE